MDTREFPTADIIFSRTPESTQRGLTARLVISSGAAPGVRTLVRVGFYERDRRPE